jgi:hypothetical protein
MEFIDIVVETIPEIVSKPGKDTIFVVPSANKYSQDPRCSNGTKRWVCRPQTTKNLTLNLKQHQYEAKCNEEAINI